LTFGVGWSVQAVQAAASGRETSVQDSDSAASAAFREAMSRVAGHVHVVATGGAAGLGGVTVTAVTPVSDSPPSLLVCLNARSATLDRIRANGAFSANALSADQEPLARIFSGEGGLEGAQRFRRGDGWDLSGRAPLLKGALAHIVCTVTDITPVGSHVVLIGRVESAAAGDDALPLMYHRRAYWGA
jgi:flavin reductase (DIM6/NTAB) family NADH-FMN oxidoreductase RutF